MPKSQVKFPSIDAAKIRNEDVSNINHADEWKLASLAANKSIKSQMEVNSFRKKQPNKLFHSNENSQGKSNITLNVKRPESPSINVNMMDSILRKVPGDDKQVNLKSMESQLGVMSSGQSYNGEINKHLLKGLVIDRLVKHKERCREPENYTVSETELKVIAKEVASKFKSLNEVLSPITRATEFLTTIKEIATDFQEVIRRNESKKELPTKLYKVDCKEQLEQLSNPKNAVLLSDLDHRSEYIKEIQIDKKALESLKENIRKLEEERIEILYLKTNCKQDGKRVHAELIHGDYKENKAGDVPSYHQFYRLDTSGKKLIHKENVRWYNVLVRDIDGKIADLEFRINEIKNRIDGFRMKLKEVYSY